MAIAILINVFLAVLWVHMFFVTGLPWFLFSSGIGAGAALVFIVMGIMDY